MGRGEWEMMLLSLMWGGGGRERGELESYPPLFFFLKRWECL